MAETPKNERSTAVILLDHSRTFFITLFVIGTIALNIFIFNATQKQLHTELTALMNHTSSAISSLTGEAQAYLAQLQLAYTTDQMTIRPEIANLKPNDPFFPLENGTPMVKKRFGSAIVRSDRAYDSSVQAVMSFSTTMNAVHTKNSHFIWSYFYDAKEQFSTVYPHLSQAEIFASTKTTTPDTAIHRIFTAGGTNPVPLVGPISNPERKMIWTKPYNDAGGKGIVVSVLAPVYKDTIFAGAFGTDVALAMLDSLLHTVKDRRLHMQVVTEEGWIVAGRGQSIENDTITNYIPKALSDHFTHQSGLCRRAIQLSNSNWYLVGTITRYSLLRELLPLLLILTIGSLTTLAIILRLFTHLKKLVKNDVMPGNP